MGHIKKGGNFMEKLKNTLLKYRFLVQLGFLACVLAGIRLVPAPYGKYLTLLLIIIGGVFFCGWACVFGTVQDALFSFGRRFTKFEITVGDRWGKWLWISRYLVLFFAAGALLAVIDARKSLSMLIHKNEIAAAAAAMLGTVLLLSTVMRRPFCRFVCPEGARYGLVSLTRLITVTRDKDLCISCGACDRKCPMAIKVSKSTAVVTPQCISCGECLKACPKSGALTPALRPFKEAVPLALMGVGIWFAIRYAMGIMAQFG